MPGWVVRLVVRLAFPRDFRERFGSDLVADAIERARRGGARWRWRGAYLGWVLYDLARSGVRCRVDRVERGSFAGVGGEVRFVLRGLRSSPGFSSTVVGMLAVGIAGCILVSSASSAYLRTDPPLPAADRLATIDYWTLPGGEGMDPWGAPTTIRQVDWSEVDSFVELVPLSRDAALALVGDGDPEWTEAARVNRAFFEVLGAGPALGRYWDGEPAEGDAVISHRLWQTQFGGSPEVLGRAVRAYPAGALEAPMVLTIVGVLPADAWMPDGLADVLLPLRTGGAPSMIRLRPGVDVGDAATRIAEMVRARSTVPVDPRWTPSVTALADRYRAQSGRLLALALGAFILMGIAVINAATLVRVRSEGRRPEFATRRAIGAPARSLRRQLLTESIVLVGTAVLLAGVAVHLASEPMAALLQTRFGTMPGGNSALKLGLEQGLVLGGGSVLLTALLTTVAAFTLREGRTGGERLRTRSVRTGWQDSLVGAQTWLSVSALVLGILLAHSAMRLARVDMGYAPEGAYAIEIPLHSDAYVERSDQVDFHRRFLDELRGAPGVEAASVVAASVEFDVPTGVTLRDRAGAEVVHTAVISPVGASFFETLRIPMVDGRAESERAFRNAEAVAVVGRAFAERAWPGESPVGRTIRVDGREDGPFTVVGVAGDVREHAVREDLPNVYLPYGRSPSYWSTVMVRAPLPFASLESRVRETLRRIDPTLPVWDIRPMSQRVLFPGRSTRLLASLLGALSLLSLAMATWGVYGNVAYRVERLGRDIRIRMALGAGGPRVAAEVAGRTVRFALAGVVGGTLTAAAGSRVVHSYLHGVGVHDPWSYAAALLLGFVVVLGAAGIASRRVQRIPLTALD